MLKRYPIVRAIYKRDVHSWFTNPTGYVFLSLFVLVCAVFLFLWENNFFTDNIASLDSLNSVYPFLLIFFVPAITMSIWAGERAQGTDELLLTLPASDLQIVAGKYLSAAGIYTVSLLFTLPQVVVLFFLGSPDLGLLIGNYLGYWLLGMAMIGAGMIGSQLSDNLTISFILGAVFCSVVVVAEWLIGLLSPDLARTWLLYFPVAMFREMSQGIVHFSAILLYGGLIVAFVYMNLLLLSRRHWSGAEGMHRSLRFVALLVGAVGLSVFGANAGGSIDTTAERIHSLSSETEALLDELDPERPVNITAFVSTEELSRRYVQVQRNLLNLLRRYDSVGGGAIRLRIVDTKRYTEEARLAQDLYGISHQEVFETEEGRRRVKDMYLGVAFTCGAEEVVIPFVYDKLPLEYELTRSIRVVSQASRSKIGVLQTEVDMFGSFDFQRGGSTPEWEIIRELKLQYEVVRVAPGEDYPGDIDVLVAPMASSLNQEQMDRLETYIKAGKPTLLLDDPVPFSAPAAAPDAPKGGPRNPFQGGPPPEQKGDFRGLIEDLDIRWNSSEIVWDLYNPHRELEEMMDREAVCVAPDSGGTQPFNTSEIITSGLQEVFVWWGGAIDEGSQAGITFTPLLQSSNRSGVISKGEAMRQSMFGGAGPNPNRRYTRRYPDRTLACRVQGTPEGAEQRIDVIFIADLDVIASFWFMLRRQSMEEGGIELDLDNVTFVLNCIDELAGDRSFIELRKRRPTLRTLTTIESATQVFEREYIKDSEAAGSEEVKAKAEEQKRFDEAVQAVKENAELDATSKEIELEKTRKIAQRRLDVRNAKISDDREAKVDRAKAKLIDGQRKTERFYGILGTVISPLLSVLIGLLVLILKTRREREFVAGARSSGGAA